MTHLCEETHKLETPSVLTVAPHERDIESLIVTGLECKICNFIISTERQRVVLQINTTCDYCAGCQDIMERKKYATM